MGDMGVAVVVGIDVVRLEILVVGLRERYQNQELRQVQNEA